MRGVELKQESTFKKKNRTDKSLLVFSATCGHCKGKRILKKGYQAGSNENTKK